MAKGTSNKEPNQDLTPVSQSTPENAPETAIPLQHPKRKRPILGRTRSATVDLGNIADPITSSTVENAAKKIRIRSKYDEYFKGLSVPEQVNILEAEQAIYKQTAHRIPFRYRVLDASPTHLSKETKHTILTKIDYYETLERTDGEYAKLHKWMSTLERLPFDRYAHFPVMRDSPLPEIQDFMKKTTQTLNDTIYGQERAKEQILHILAQRISNPNSVCSVIALTGPPGVGKTSLVKHGVSKALGHPFAFTALGGACDASFLEGHSYTYEGSTPGRIVEMLLETQCMNPILFFDELDKISDSAKGEEISHILTHITDTTQNSTFMDKYLHGIPIDISKSILFFSLNDISRINPILRDRLTIIEFDKYGLPEKTQIFQNYLLKEVCQNIGLNHADYLFTPEMIQLLVEKLPQEDGIRNLKRGLEKLMMKINYEMYMPKEKRTINPDQQLPLTVTRKMIEDTVREMLGADHTAQKSLYEQLYI
jgi:ATP-dependent Lon protease